ncbi:thiamine pyrophosphate-binding protein [Ammoniphilus sp. CFH 90114]|uniref:thiamine pyrophosphate-binding protein n=1 Tax=Ammoniphilus sp. CFH 90114 TaxID=2493665 RepID=UPI0013E97DAA|nr:thiamine pyrophosphate-binding protein [Ammoniphilus sp. CFH 90114]
MEKTAMILAKHLKEEGIEYAFGIPGGEVLELLEAFRLVGIEFILTKHEMGAGFMADAYYQLTGKPGVLVSTLGPGITNTVTPVANAYLDRSAMIVITGEVSTKLKGVYTHQILEQRDLLKPVTKWSTTLGGCSDSQSIQKAIDICKSGYPGPVHINIPTDVAVMQQKYIPRRKKTTSKVGPAAETIDAFVNSLREAKKPVVLAGVGVALEDAPAIQSFCRNWSVPLITTYKAKGLLPENDVLCFGGTGLSPVADGQHMQLVRDDADLVITIGFDPVELRSDWNLSWQTKTWNIDIVPNEYQLIPVDQEYVGNIQSFFESVNQITEVESKWKQEDCLRYKEDLVKKIEPQEREGLSPFDVVSTCRELLPQDAIAIVDTGSHRIMLNHVWQCYEPKTLLQSNGLGSMGYALPAGIAAQMVHRDRPVVIFTGDAGFDMIIGELAMLPQHQLPVTIVVFNDQLLSLIRLKQSRMNLETTGVEFSGINYQHLAKAYNGNGITVETVEELQAALKEVQSSPTFTIIDARVNPAEYWQQM